MKKNYNEIQKQIDNLKYWDSRVTKLECNYFADEVTLVYEDEENIVSYEFKGCYEVLFKHIKSYDKMKPASEMTIGQLPYFMQRVEILSEIINEIEFYKCKIEMFPLTLEILCKNIIILNQ